MIPSAVRRPRVTVLTPWRRPTRWWPRRPSPGRWWVGKTHERAARRAYDVGAALGARALLEQDELAPVEVDPRHGEDGHRLEGEGDVAVEVLVQGVPVALAVAQHERRRPRLARRAAAREQLVVLGGERVRLAPSSADQSLATGASWR